MTRRRLLFALCTAALSTAGVTTAAAAPAHVARAPVHLLVYAQEWSLWPSRSVLPAGRVIVELWNRGQDPHDLRIQRLNGAGTMVGRAQGIPATDPGQIRRATWTLGRGRYEIYCAMPGHMRLGMHARLTVR